MVLRGISDFCTSVNTERKERRGATAKELLALGESGTASGENPARIPKSRKVCPFPAPACMRMVSLMSVLETTARHLVERLRDAGFKALYAGGCVRDMLLGLEPHDYDIATDARPEQVQQLFDHTFAVGAHFGVVVVHREGHDFQIATFRSDGAYVDGRRPTEVTFSSAQTDAERRDFTVNGLFFDPITNEVIDYVNGRADLVARRLRAIGDPIARFREDRLRL